VAFSLPKFSFYSRLSISLNPDQIILTAKGLDSALKWLGIKAILDDFDFYLTKNKAIGLYNLRCPVNGFSLIIIFSIQFGNSAIF